jgi:hypothetical protein
MKNLSKALFALVAVTITLGALWHTNRVVFPKKATRDDVKAEARQGGSRLISS